ncbi:hypothetical protein LLG96_19825 [bacterium]|nr:hypothetical protein [bacterium]
MKNKFYIVFLFFALVALTMIGYDYVCGHMGENPLIPNKCLLCQAYQSTELVHYFTVFFGIFSIMPLLGFIIVTDNLLFPLQFLTVISLRAPPCA